VAAANPALHARILEELDAGIQRLQSAASRLSRQP
jgi:hypothetical protein